jgi:helicase MOV-10
MKVTVHFSFNRNCLRNMHRALDLINNHSGLTNICYPKTYGSFTEDIKIPNWFNRMISLNPQQCQAVQNIICGTSKPSPYLIFGPPGTGKTVTIVESIKQIFHLLPQARVLATAPSNAAADLLADRIMESVPKSKIIRLYGPSRDYRTVPEKLRPVSNFYEEECIFPAKNKLMEYRIVVTTVIVSGRFVSSGFPTGHFDFIYVDECGHGLEASSLVRLFINLLLKIDFFQMQRFDTQLLFSPVESNLFIWVNSNCFSKGIPEKVLRAKSF